MQESLDVMIEAILFSRSEPMTLPELCRALKQPSGEVKKSLLVLEEKLKGRGIALIRANEEIALATVPEAHELIERLRKEELSRDLGKAALETLSIVLYKREVSRRDIDYIRGVKSTAILRSLLIRGLVERIPSPTDERMFLYRPTAELVTLLGITNIEELPEYHSVQAELGARSEVGEKEQEDASIPKENEVEPIT